MSNVIQLHTTQPAKAAGIFAQVNIAARNMGYSPALALKAAISARSRYLAGGVSPARVIADQRASLRQNAEPVTA